MVSSRVPVAVARSPALLRVGRTLRSAMRALTKRVLRFSGLDVHRKPGALIRSPSEMVLTFEYVASHFACRHLDRDVMVLQVGAFDGEANDHVSTALDVHGWHGVLVEPQREPFESLERRYLGNKRVRLFNVAVADEDGFRTMYRIGPSQTASFSKSHVVKHVANPEVARIEEECVECWTFGTLFARAGIERVDVLQIDAEGYDLELLRLFDIGRTLHRS